MKSYGNFNVHFYSSDKERARPFQVLTSPRESRAGVKDSSPLPRPEIMQHVEDMAKKLLSQDEVAAVMRHCQRVNDHRSSNLLWVISLSQTT